MTLALVVDKAIDCQSVDRLRLQSTETIGSRLTQFGRSPVAAETEGRVVANTVCNGLIGQTLLTKPFGNEYLSVRYNTDTNFEDISTNLKEYPMKCKTINKCIEKMAKTSDYLLSILDGSQLRLCLTLKLL